MKLTGASKRLIFVGLVSVVSLALASQAWAQAPTDCPRAPTGRGSVPQSAQRVVDNADASPADLAVALGDCISLGTLPGRMCAGTARLRMAQASPNAGFDNFRLARCDFYAAAALATRARDTATASRANGRAAEAVLGMRDSDPSRAGTFDDELLRLHASVGAEFPRVHQAVAQLYLRRGQANTAADEAIAHLRGNDLSQVLMTVAASQTGEAREATLQRAYAADSTSISTNTSLGEVYFNAGQTDRAEQLFNTAIGLSPRAGEEGRQEQAHYYLSMIDANRSNLIGALDHAEHAGNGLPAVRQNCLVRLKIGDREVFNRAPGQNGRLGDPIPYRDLVAYDRCSRLGQTPEGQLLVGLFWLRRSQYRPAPTIGTQAERDYHTELAWASQAFDTPVDDAAELDWPGSPAVAGRHVKVRDVLAYGRQLAAYFDGFCRSQIQPNDRGTGAAQLFAYYGIAGCRPS